MRRDWTVNFNLNGNESMGVNSKPPEGQNPEPSPPPKYGNSGVLTTKHGSLYSLSEWQWEDKFRLAVRVNEGVGFGSNERVTIDLKSEDCEPGVWYVENQIGSWLMLKPQSKYEKDAEKQASKPTYGKSPMQSAYEAICEGPKPVKPQKADTFADYLTEATETLAKANKASSFTTQEAMDALKAAQTVASSYVNADKTKPATPPKKQPKQSTILPNKDRPIRLIRFEDD